MKFEEKRSKNSNFLLQSLFRNAVNISVLAFEVFSKCCFRSCVIIRVYVGARLITLSFWAHPSTCAKS